MTPADLKDVRFLVEEVIDDEPAGSSRSAWAIGRPGPGADSRTRSRSGAPAPWPACGTSTWTWPSSRCWARLAYARRSCRRGLPAERTVGRNLPRRANGSESASQAALTAEDEGAGQPPRAR